MSNDQLHDTSGANLSVSDVSLDVAGVAAPALPTSLTLTGAGFGAVANTKPTMYDDFSEYGVADGTEITDYTSTAKWEEFGGGTAGSYRITSEAALPWRQFGAESMGRKAMMKRPKRVAGGADPDYNKIYASWYVHFNERLGAANQLGAVSDKLLRLWDDDGGLGMRTSWLATTQDYNINARFAYFDKTPFTVEDNTWHRLEVFVTYTAGVCSHTFWIDGKKAGYIEDLDVSGVHEGGNASTVLTDSNRPWGNAPMAGCRVYNLTNGTVGKIQNGSDVNGDNIGLVSVDGESPIQLNTGDNYRIAGPVGHLGSAAEEAFFVDLIGYDPSSPEHLHTTLRHRIGDFVQMPSMASVELSNSPTYDDSGKQKRILQICDTRSDTEIVIADVNYGDLDKSLPIYAFIRGTEGQVIATQGIA